MASSWLEKILQLFGTKSQRDVKRMLPLLEKTKAEIQRLQALSHEALREEAEKAKGHVQEVRNSIATEMAQLRARLQAEDLPIAEKEKLFEAIKALEKEENKRIEKTLEDLLPQAFALMREIARRFKEHDSLEVRASYADKAQALHKDYIDIQGDKALWKNRWMVAGHEMVWDMVHFDVQLLGGIALHQGNIAEMATGEGKTLVATLPAFLNAIAGKGVHIVTVNPYLAKRDCAWNAPLFEFYGLTVDCIDNYEPHSAERIKAYQASITYGTNNEFGFDYLRDNMARTEEDRVQRGHHYVMVDEVDSVLIDEARTPLIISGPVSKKDEPLFYELKPRVVKLVDAQLRLCTQYLQEAKHSIASNKREEGGLAFLRVQRGMPKYKPFIRYLSEQGMKQALQKTENQYLQDNQRRMPEVDEPLYFKIDEKNHSIELTEKGIAYITEQGEDAQLFVMPDMASELARIEKDTSTSQELRLQEKEKLIAAYKEKSEHIHTIQQLLRAYTLYEKDTEYVVMESKVKIVDEQTGRILEGRRYADGLHQAIEAKENVKVEESTQTYATITLQNYFRMYHKLAGMTGTAETEAGEFWNIYKLDVVIIPTHKAVIRADRHDKVYKSMREKFNALIEEIAQLIKEKRPVLVGTTSVETSELLSRMFTLRHIPHQVLNAKQHQKEAEVIAQAGKPATVTIATNMAGRGTDIKLSKESREAGGLAIIGTERHESRRVDRQLRGRSGRQGDPGTSQFFISLEDHLMRLFGSERIAQWMDRMGLKEGEVIQHKMISNSIGRAQRKVEENNFSIRKRLLEYDNVMNSQREVIYTRRQHALRGGQLQVDLYNMCFDVVALLCSQAKAENNHELLMLSLMEELGMHVDISLKDFEEWTTERLTQHVFEKTREAYQAHHQKIRDTAMPVIEYTYQSKGQSIRNIVVPVFSHDRQIGVVVPLEACAKEQCYPLSEAIEKTITLSVIDHEWKEHLREMDDLKQSVQNVVYEQKDPLLIYKFESFELFKKLIARINTDTLSFLMKAQVPRPEQAQVREAESRGQQQERLRESKEEANSLLGTPRRKQEDATPAPVRSQKVAGRNEKVTVQYNDGTLKKEVKYKRVEEDIKQNRCVLVEVHQ